MSVNGVATYRFFFSSRRRHTRLVSDWSSDVCSSDLAERLPAHHDMGGQKQSWELEQGHPQQQEGEQDAAGEDHGRTQQQANAGPDLYDSTEIDYDGPAGQGLADRLPDQSRISVNQTDDAQADHHCREECTARPDRYAHGPHRNKDYARTVTF